MKVKLSVAQSCLTLCNPVDCRPPGSSVHGILQARIPKWVAIPFSRGSSRPRDQTWVSRIADRLSSELPGKPVIVLPVNCAVIPGCKHSYTISSYCITKIIWWNESRMPEQFPHLLVLGCRINAGATESLKQAHSKPSMRKLKLNKIFVNRLQRKFHRSMDFRCQILCERGNTCNRVG